MNVTRLTAFAVQLAAVVIAIFSAGSASTASERPPNIVLLFTDDQRADTIAALGNPIIKTPNLDRLVERGYIFRNAYCLGSNMPAVCTPSRNMLMSGQAYFRYEGPQAPAELPNIPASLNAAGYETWHYGKRGNTAHKIHELFQHNQYLDDEADRTSGQPGKTIVDAAIQFLSNRDSERPFFMYLALANPHDPRVASDEFRSHYDAATIPLPTNFLPQHPFDNGELQVRDEKLAAWPRSEDEIGAHLVDYYATITGLDHHLGRFLDEMKRLSLDEQTIVIFTSDHGLAVGSHGLMGKQNLYEHSMKVPLIVVGPSIRHGHSDALVYLHDFFPTICHWARTEIPNSLDGRNLAPVMNGQVASLRDDLFLAYCDVQRAVRDQRYKLIVYPQIDRMQLFDLHNDPHELHDLSTQPGHEQRIADLTARLAQWQTRLGDHSP